MPHKKTTPAGGTAGVGATMQVAANNASATHSITSVKPVQNGLPLALSQQIDCALYLAETAQDPVVKSFAQIALRRLEASIPSESRR